jgi:phenylpropionate dioxygenase-like ring-hydroxylating dioxygenase large terminal subunit
MVIADRIVSEDGSYVQRDAFYSQELYEQEQERIFRRCWLFLGHESQLSKPRDFFTTYMGEEPVIVTRDSSGQINALLNTCRHRGMQVCRADKGNTASFTCSYHAWTYDTTGALIGVPRLREGYFEELDKSQWGLVRVAQVESYKGLIFATFDPDQVPLKEYLGDMAYYLDIVLDRREGGTMVMDGVQKWIIKSNWKLQADNHAGDGYHIPYAHGSNRLLNAALRGGNLPPGQLNPGSLQVSAELGHTLVGSYMDDPQPISGATTSRSNVQQYFQDQLPEAIERLGPTRSRFRFAAGTVFPTFGLVPGSNTIRVFHPRGPEKFECWAWCLVDKDAPEDVKRSLAREYILRFGPTGTFEQDDGENFSRLNSVSRNYMGRQLQMNYKMGAGHDRFHEDLPGMVSRSSPAELAQRSFYSRWAKEMNNP